ncbi:RrF2 family transcriptional regulator [Roseovarius salinarum]|uniref:RrF2 family transcriptional regulator n=1 Tax=Roseovarius salinarum TaxID=1981892 RepID=UPI000C32CB14|nr:Rrf2 family transcriptional regulator [Roseovarius salinarum]
MRITKRTNIAIRVLMYCGVNSDRLVTKTEIADRCNASESHLAQVINQLAQLGYLSTQRGRNGGIALGRPMNAITIGEVFRALETGVPLAECFADVDNTCPLVHACRLRLAIADAAEAFYSHLDGISLDALVCGNEELFDLFLPQACPKQG